MASQRKPEYFGEQFEPLCETLVHCSVENAAVLWENHRGEEEVEEAAF